MRYRSPMVLAALILSAGLAHAATVTPVEGTISINTGTGFRPVIGAGEVVAGDRILVAEGGKAKISYSASCSAEIQPGVFVVPSQPVCQASGSGRGLDPRLVLGGAVVAGTVAVAIAASTSDDRPASP